MHMNIGDRIAVSRILDGSMMMDGGVLYGQTPKRQWELQTKSDRQNRVRLGLNALLVQTQNANLLIDTGAGGKRLADLRSDYNLNGNKLIRELRKCGLTARDIDIVALTNLHWDHSGGCTKLDREGAPIPTFPNARYMMQRAAWDAAMSPNERYLDAFDVDDFEPLEDRDQVEFLGDGDTIIPGVSVRQMSGTSLGSQVIFLTFGGERIIYAGDLIPTQHHLPPHRIQADAEFPNDTLAQKRELLEMAMTDGWLIVFGHGFDCFAGYVQRKNGDPYLLPMAA